MELTQLLYFKTIAECSNMTRASEKLHVSQPALSASVKRLEEELGIRLFERHKNKIILNDNGRQALAYTDIILAKSTEMKNIFNRYAGSKQMLVLGFCDPGPMRFSVPLFQKDNPGLNIRSELLENEDNIAGWLKEYKYDAIISINKPDNPEIETVPFAGENLLLSVPETYPLAQNREIYLAAAAPMEMAVYCGEGAYVRWLEPFLEKLARHHKVKFYNDYFVFRQILEQNNLPTLTTRLVSQYRYDGSNRKVIPITDEGVEIIYRLSYLKANAKNILPLLTWVQKAQETL